MDGGVVPTVDSRFITGKRRSGAGCGGGYPVIIPNAWSCSLGFRDARVSPLRSLGKTIVKVIGLAVGVPDGIPAIIFLGQWRHFLVWQGRSQESCTITVITVVVCC